MHYLPYSSYKTTNLAWSENIPSHWSVRRLRFVVNEPLKYGLNEPAEMEDRDQVRYIRITDIDQDGSLRDDTFKSLPDSIARPYLLKHGDILFARSGATVGKHFMYRESWGQACYAGYLIRARIDPKIALPEFVSYFTDSDLYWQWVASVFIQATIQNISGEKYGNLATPIPPIHEQQVIVDFLDRETTTIDTLIAKKRQLIQVLQKKRMALVSHAVTKGLDPNVRMKDSGVDWLGKIPEHWKVVLIKRHYEVALGKMLNASTQLGREERKPYLRAANVKWEGIDIEDINMMEFSAQQRDRYRLFQGDLLVTEGGVTVGRSAIWEGQIEECYYQNSLNRVRRRSGLSIRFLYYWMYFLKESGYIDLVSDKATFGHLTNEELSALPVVVVPSSEESTILDYLDSQLTHIAKITELTNKAIKKLQQYRTALISSAVTGKIDVRNYQFIT